MTEPLATIPMSDESRDAAIERFLRRQSRVLAAYPFEPPAPTYSSMYLRELYAMPLIDPRRVITISTAEIIRPDPDADSGAV